MGFVGLVTEQRSPMLECPPADLPRRAARAGWRTGAGTRRQPRAAACPPARPHRAAGASGVIPRLGGARAPRRPRHRPRMRPRSRPCLRSPGRGFDSSASAPPRTRATLVRRRSVCESCRSETGRQTMYDTTNTSYFLGPSERALGAHHIRGQVE